MLMTTVDFKPPFSSERVQADMEAFAMRMQNIPRKVDVNGTVLVGVMDTDHAAYILRKMFEYPWCPVTDAMMAPVLAVLQHRLDTRS